MCNEVARHLSLEALLDGFDAVGVALAFPERRPNMAPLPSVRITDRTVIVRQSGTGGAEVVTRRWSWPGPGGRPVYNYRSDGRDVKAGRCLVPIDAFFEFTLPEAGAKSKTRWAFTHARQPWFALGGLWRSGMTLPNDPSGEAFTLLTCPPGPDVAPYHQRQMVVIERKDWAAWLDGSAPSGRLTVPLPAGTLTAARV